MANIKLTITALLLCCSLAISVIAQEMCPVNQTLSNGSILFADLIAPKKWTTYNVKAHFGTADVDIKAKASVGLGIEGTPALHYTYVIDRSDSTTEECGNGQTVLACEQEALRGLHEQIKDGRSAVDFGVVQFDDTGDSFDFAMGSFVGADSNGTFVTTDVGSNDGDVDTAINNVTSGDGTSFAAGLEAALRSINQSAATGEKRIIFLSDGENSLDSPADFDAALEQHKNAGTVIFSFAVGSSSMCAGDLQQMADETNGICEEVTDVADLENVLISIFASEITFVELTLNGNSLHQVEGPFDGPLSMNIDSTATFLPQGNYEACIQATGRVPQEDSFETSATCCVWFSVESVPPDYYHEPKEHYPKDVDHTHYGHGYGENGYNYHGEPKAHYPTDVDHKHYGHGYGENGYNNYGEIGYNTYGETGYNNYGKKYGKKAHGVYHRGYTGSY